MLALVPVIGVVLVSLLVTRVATVILTTTGMSSENARFQARSALSGVGYTTDAAEAVVRHPARRRVIFTLMLMGSGGLVTAVAGLIVTFGNQAHNRGGRLLILIGGLALVWLVSRSRWVDRWMQNIAARMLGARGWASRHYATLARLAGGHAIGELKLRDGWPAGLTLEQAGLGQHGVAVMGIEPDGRAYESLPGPETVLREGDTLIVYGPGEVLQELDERGEELAGAAAR